MSISNINSSSNGGNSYLYSVLYCFLFPVVIGETCSGSGSGSGVSVVLYYNNTV